jgi:hypothetical protein
VKPDDDSSAVRASSAAASAAAHPRAPAAATASGLLLLAGVLGGGAAGFGASQLSLRPVHEALAARPAIVVQDMGAALMRVSPQDAALVIGEQQRLARRLGESGALVLDADAVLAAPAALYVNRRAAPPPSLDGLGLGGEWDGGQR